MDWSTIAALVTALLGGQGLIELVKYFLNRKTEGRVAEAHADSEEFATISQTNLFLQQQLKEKEERFAAQTLIVRKQNDEIIQLTKDKAEVELEYERYKAEKELELERVRCNDHPCPWREPPNAWTKPKPTTTTKDEYHQSKRKHEEN